jgi:hypothetical protein
LNQSSIVGGSEDFCHKPTILFQDLRSQFECRKGETILFKCIVSPILSNVRSTVVENAINLKKLELFFCQDLL